MSNFNAPAGSEAISYAGFWWRFLAAFIDGILTLIVMSIINVVINIPFALMGATLGGNGHAMMIIPTLINLVLNIVLRWLYFALMESSEKQATLGKLICGLRVTDMGGERIDFKRATGRYFAKILSGVLLLVGFIMAAFTEHKQGLHDILAKTLVLKASDV